jgi:hypothetical protein
MTVNDVGKTDLYQWLYFLAQHHVYDTPTHFGIRTSRKKLIVWASMCAVGIVLVGYWVGVYAAIIMAGSVAATASMRQLLGLWAAYLTAIPVGAVAFYWFASQVGGPPQGLYELLLEISMCLAFGVVLTGPVTLGIACLLQLIVDFVTATPQPAEPASDDVATRPPQ